MHIDLAHLTNGYALTGYALSLVFGAVMFVLKQKKPSERWIVPTSFVLAAVCIAGGLVLAYKGQSAPAEVPAPPASPSMTIGNIDQHGSECASAGVQGSNTINCGPSQKK